ncbi:hypothetical protein BHE90_015933 [Fusarium euwallaceae]|uniref:Uncharacterized protein n=4 Tax=Fusarium solani species complex TaxID=232080 RepID=A0A3M2RI67_9HYPO|nr:hypothetical protein CDV36_014471 [Fusarium kuroshium]RSL86968.1 hypothetical protein CEP52_015674 [Fusarium oligoseptatum]RSM05694.1 hypothetical protein CDV31_009470 [Fusarium ambrosium]RTE69684.1 hypothetical protein BHE90_015933 [Fusarium euwallaceae]
MDSPGCRLRHSHLPLRSLLAAGAPLPMISVHPSSGPLVVAGCLLMLDEPVSLSTFSLRHHHQRNIEDFEHLDRLELHRLPQVPGATGDRRVS